MPYHWTEPTTGEAETPPPVAHLRLWPHRSLPRTGFVRFFGATAALGALPILTVVGSPVLWGLLPFFLLTMGGLWAAIQFSYRTGEVLEDLRLWPDRVELVRQERRRPLRRWEANPHWVRPALHKEGGPVPNYLTLTGAGRTVELGAFLSEDERLSLWQELPGVLGRLGQATAEPRS
ncbi:MAG TPA: DUF2244 domain-containing protein [Rubellimicrobium sp.]|jgi:uncharacterized membrane protein|nr:DUF2244 domain-containing protein [Rubellimicrobium sp.]